MKCFGIFLHTVIAGWDESECSTAFHFVAECSQVQRYIAIVVQHGPGVCVYVFVCSINIHSIKHLHKYTRTDILNVFYTD